jgi:hypothetical protein
VKIAIALLGLLALSCAGDDQSSNDSVGSGAAPEASTAAMATASTAGQSSVPADPSGAATTQGSGTPADSASTDSTPGEVTDGSNDPTSDDGARGAASETEPQTDDSAAMAQDDPSVTDDGAQPADEASAEADSMDTPVAGDATGDAPPIDEGVLEDLATYLDEDAATRAPIAEQAFAEVPLTAEQAEQAAAMLWEDRAETVRETRQAEHDARVITIGEFSLRFDYAIFGDKPEDGRSLFLSLHGGGNATSDVNDSQWENQKQLYQPDEGVYLAPRAPTDTWNLWHQDHIDPLFQRLITNPIVLEDINPNRVYVMGFSAGGDAVYQLGPRMADYWAAASAMAGHPNEAKPLSLRNICFTIHVGELDTDYDRNLIAQEWSDELDALETADPGGYVHEVQIHAGKPHWMDLEDAVALPWMAEFTRNPVPDRIVWYQDDVTHSRSYWLAVEDPRVDTTVTADLDGQLIQVSSEDVDDVSVRLRDDMLDLDQSVTIEFNGSEVFSGKVSRTIAVLADTLDEREDPEMMFSAEVPLSGM